MFPSLSVLVLLVICIFQHSLADIALPKALLEKTPECAFECVKTFVQEQLDLSTSCSDSTDLLCLCEAQSFNGYTLAEGVLACNAEQCPTAIYNQKTNVYQICTFDPDAVPSTHSVIDASSALPFSIPEPVPTISASSIQPPATSRKAVSTSAMPSTSSAQSSSTTTSLATLATRSSSTNILSTATSILPGATSIVPDSSSTVTLSQTAAAATSAAADAPILGTGQIAGIAVAGTVTAATAVGLLFFIFCGQRFRKRNKRRDSDASFGGSHVFPSDPEAPSGQNGGMVEIPKPMTPLIPPPMHSGPKQHQILGLPVAPNQPRNQHRQSWWNSKSASKENLKPETPSQIGVAKHLTPHAGGVSQDTSPSSIASYVSTSKLLPEKPSYSMTRGNVHEQKAYNNIPSNQPIPLGGGVGLRVTAPTPEPSEHPPPGMYSTSTRVGRDESRHTLKNEPSMEGSKLKGKLSDPFLQKPGEKSDLGHPSTIMFRPALSKIRTASAANSGTKPRGPRVSQPGPLPNFRGLVRPQPTVQTPPHRHSPPPQLPSVTPFSPISPDLPTSNPAIISYDPQNEMSQSQSIMNRPRNTQSPFWKPQQSREPAYRPFRVRSKRVRPETYYTTGSETEFEDEEPSPLSPPDLPAHMAIAELPALSPVAESPASRATHDKIATRTPSPRVRGSPPSNGDQSTPLSRLRYPEIPCASESPRREVGTVPLAIGLPREISAVHIAQLHKSSISPLSDSPRGRHPSTGSTIISPGFESPTRLPETPLLGLVAGSQQKPKLIPSPLRPGRNSQQNRPVLEDVPPPPPPKDDPKDSYPTPSTTHISARKFHEAAQKLGSNDAAVSAFGSFSNHPVELPARGSGGLGNWPVQPTRFSQPMKQTKQFAPPRPSLDQGREMNAAQPTPDTAFASGTVRMVPQDNASRVIIPGPQNQATYAQPFHQPRDEALVRPVVQQGNAPVDYKNHAQKWAAKSEDRLELSSGDDQRYLSGRDPRMEFQRLREIERSRAYERHYEQQRQQAEISRTMGGFDPSLSTAPLLPSRGNETAPRSVMKTWGVNQGQARRDLLNRAGAGAGSYELHDPRGI